MPQRDRIAVFGLYKTGTTALYSNIRQALPYSPRTMFEADHYVAVDGDSESGVLAKVIVGQVNTDYASFAGFDKKILLVRDPRGWIISGYAADWRLDEHPRIAPEHGSGYVARVVDRKRAMDAAGSGAQ